MTAWQVVGPTGHTVAIYDRESTARRVAVQLGYRAFPWTAESAVEPSGVGEPAGDGVDASVAVSAPFPGELRGLRGGAA